MSFNFSKIRETIKIKRKSLKLKLMVTSGKDGEYYVLISPAIMVSGYGRTPADAQDSFKENAQQFCLDLLALSTQERESELLKLGFTREKKFTHRDYSKAYIDQNGLLQGIEPGTMSSKILEAEV